MARTDRLYAGSHYVTYGQIGLWDKADLSAYPIPDGPLPWWGPKGVVVPALDDVEVIVHVIFPPAASDDGFSLLAEGQIQIGERGITVGNVTSASTVDIAVPKGRYRVTCSYRGMDPAAATELSFVLSHLPPTMG